LCCRPPSLITRRLKQIDEVHQITGGSACQQVVNERKGGGHSPGFGREAFMAGQRIQPYDPVDRPAQTSHLECQLSWIARVPTVGNNQCDRSTPDATGPVLVEIRESFAYSGSSRPVRDLPSDLFEGIGWVPSAELSRDSRESSGKHERFDPVEFVLSTVDKMEQHL